MLEKVGVFAFLLSAETNETERKKLFNTSIVRLTPHKPDRHPEGTDSDLNKILHICLDSWIHKKLPKLKFVHKKNL
jgi:hypothetical protein